MAKKPWEEKVVEDNKETIKRTAKGYRIFAEKSKCADYYNN